MPLRIALCDDFREERWPSMDRVAAMLDRELSSVQYGRRYDIRRVCPRFERFARGMPLAGRSPVAFRIDRYLNRFWAYPRFLQSRGEDFDLFHIVDHSYAHLAHVLPPERTIVTCHDLDAFRSLTSPADEPRSAAFRRMTRRIAMGLARAARVVCDTDAVRHELVEAGFVDASRTVVAPLGVDEVFLRMDDDRPADGRLEILHVGSNVRRKRLDVLLRVCGGLTTEFPELRLVRVGDPLTPDQRRLAREMGIAERIAELHDIDEPTLAGRYRQAAIVLQPSDREGFGLPVLEALASGTPVVASDLPVLREVGGPAVTFCPAGDVRAWRDTVAALLRERTACPSRWRARRDAGRAHARRFTWQRCADVVAGVYEQVAGEPVQSFEPVSR